MRCPFGGDAPALFSSRNRNRPPISTMPSMSVGQIPRGRQSMYSSHPGRPSRTNPDRNDSGRQEMLENLFNRYL